MIGLQVKRALAGALAAAVLGGLAPAAAQADFGIVPGSFKLSATNQEGSADTLAGSHPYEVSTSFDLDRTTFSNGTEAPGGALRDIVVETPAGLIGNPSATSQCTRAQLASSVIGGCPANSEVGEETLTFLADEFEGSVKENVYNMVAPPGVPAQFAFKILTTTVYLNASVRTGGDYGITFEIGKIAQTLPLVASTLTFWGVPADHNESGEPPRPFLTMPTKCGSQSEAVLRVDSWQQPGAVNPNGSPDLSDPAWQTASTPEPALTGCEALAIKPSLHTYLDGHGASSPAGLHVDLGVPQTDAAVVPATPTVQDASIALPTGVTINPAGAAGRVGCPLDGAEGIDLSSPEAAHCPDASKIGTVSIETPLLKSPMSGGVYLAQQGNLAGEGTNPFGSLLAVYIAAEGGGVVLKLAGKVEADPLTGQVTASFKDDPQLPFSDLKLDFFDGPRAALSTPPACGSYTSSGTLTPYSSTTPVSLESAPFAITSGCGGGFAPTLKAGSVNPHAGAYSPFAMTLRRQDGERALSTVALSLPKGLAGMIAGVPLCGEAQANAGDCPAASKIGHVSVQAGVGSDPISLPQAGLPQDPVYLTGPYGGGPFGLSIVVPAQAGPFDLGTVVVRAAIDVNPSTAQVSVKSGPLPQMLQGIPLDVQAIDVTIDRGGFMFNPTSCAPQSITGSVGAAEGGSAAVSTRFQAADCARLPFKLSFSALVHARHTRAKGEYLRVKIATAAGGANIAKVKVTLPKKLPSRLDTLKLACTAAQFAANPAGCPSGSLVGSASVRTPILPVPMRGSAIFVSHGGSGFPNLDLVLRGDGVTIVLVGNTSIQKGITTSTFASVPDVPVRSVELTLPQSEHSALAGEGDLCAAPLYMPTTITGQNGAVSTRRTQIEVSGCKPEIRVTSRKAGRTQATLSVSVPAAGTLRVSGKGIASAAVKARGPKTVKLTLTPSKSTQELLSHHPGRRLKVSVRLRFTPLGGGKAISGRTSVLIG